jgi:hypothetical protein
LYRSSCADAARRFALLQSIDTRAAALIGVKAGREIDFVDRAMASQSQRV